MHPSTLLVERIGLAFGIAAALLAVATFVHAMVRVTTSRSAERRIAAGSTAIVTSLTSPGDPTAEDLRQLRPRRLFELLLPFATRVGDDAGLIELARQLGAHDIGRKWRRSHRTWRRLRGTRVGMLLDQPGPDTTRLLTDRSAEVRAAAAEWASRDADDETVDRLLALLDDAAPGCAFAATDALIRLGPRVTERLKAHLSAGDPAHLVRSLTIAAHVRDPRLAPVALDLVGHQDPGVRTAAAAVLGAVGTAEAIDALLAATLDADPGVRAGAASALGRLEAWPAAPTLGLLLRDDAWDVRRAAVYALLGLGAPGRLVLQAATNDGDRFAADIARLALSLPIGSTPRP